jgi:hypothetical protein
MAPVLNYAQFSLCDINKSVAYSSFNASRKISS